MIQHISTRKNSYLLLRRSLLVVDKIALKLSLSDACDYVSEMSMTTDITLQNEIRSRDQIFQTSYSSSHHSVANYFALCPCYMSTDRCDSCTVGPCVISYRLHSISHVNAHYSLSSLRKSGSAGIVVSSPSPSTNSSSPGQYVSSSPVGDIVVD